MLNFYKKISNWFGLNNGSYINEPPQYVDKEKLPGMSEIPKPTVLGWITNAPFVLITTPNFVWASIATSMYYYVPYNLHTHSIAALAPISYNFILERFPLWFTIVFGYNSFWHIVLYFFNLASRPFIMNRPYNVQKVIHNMFWTTSGIFIWTIFENIFCYLWASGRLLYVNSLFSFVIALMGIPIWRSIHFYFAHRLLHFGPLYQEVHSLHHRNTDVEPFSGLCMHPIEHLYYYSCILPSLLFICSPFAFLWNGVHLLLSPAASHSGWEDHFQSDAFHYMHHRYFECNYAGTDAAFMDIMFCTFKGSFSDVDKDGPKPREDAKSTLFSYPTIEFTRYITLCFSCIFLWGYFALGIANKTIVLNELQRFVISFGVGFGPVLIAWILSNIFHKNTTYVKSIKMTIVGNLIHISIGSLFCSVPITYLCWLTLLTK